MSKAVPSFELNDDKLSWSFVPKRWWENWKTGHVGLLCLAAPSMAMFSLPAFVHKRWNLTSSRSFTRLFQAWGESAHSFCFGRKRWREKPPASRASKSLGLWKGHLAHSWGIRARAFGWRRCKAGLKMTQTLPQKQGAWHSRGANFCLPGFSQHFKLLTCTILSYHGFPLRVRHEVWSAGSSRNGWCCGWWRGSAWQPCGARDVQYWGTDSLWRGAAQTTRQHTEMGCKMQMSIQPSVWDCIPGCHRIWSSIDPKRTKHTYSSCDIGIQTPQSKVSDVSSVRIEF